MCSIKKYIFFIGFVFFPLNADDTLFVGFSKDRPLQVTACLESVDYYIKGIRESAVIYHAKNDDFENGYEIVKNYFQNVCFFMQSRADSQADFKPLLLEVLKTSKVHYVLFAVDDIIVTDYINLDEAIKVLEETDAYGVYFRLGKDITHCYALNQHSGVPTLSKVAPSFYKWKFLKAQGDWNYPHTVDLALYRKKDVLKTLEHLSFGNPNQLEGMWAARAPRVTYGLCCEYSKMINIPVNLVQNVWKNRHTNEYSPEELLELFTQGYRIDVAYYHKYAHTSPHIACSLVFVQ